jgi:hypothetical protein
VICLHFLLGRRQAGLILRLIFWMIRSVGARGVILKKMPLHFPVGRRQAGFVSTMMFLHFLVVRCQAGNFESDISAFSGRSAPGPVSGRD